MSAEPSIHQLLAHPKNWKGGIEEYLKQNGVTAGKVIPLEGGTSCYLWRLDGVRCRSDSAITPLVQTAVLKCADSMAKAGPIAVDPNRLQTEVIAVRSQAVTAACRQSSSVRVPTILQQTHHGIIMSWAGETDLRTLHKTHGSFDMSNTGAHLGDWLAYLHLEGISSGPGEIEIGNATLEKAFSGPGGMEEQAIKSVLSATDDIELVLKLLRIPSPVRTVTHWDFRPSNIVLNVSKESDASPELTVVDWELCHYGDPVNDIRMWVAETIMMEATQCDRGLLSSFLTAYKRRAGKSIVNDVFVRKVAVAVGVFLLYFLGQGAELWGFTEQDLQKWRNIAIEYINAGAHNDVIWLSRNALQYLMD
ncbi:hypothetical protein PTNB73_07587 [Pyrenophora teres f. teres]|uniref:Phosphotransferase enzyme family protein n=1 Tax=Pyrenophora teres f. teres TaxID=97479 RepID=A0A6S6WE28_9PLEO|nr:hypothetical protein PTNB85_09290 [Pyrenophora teres f. teres]KAE8832037.1 hypothetical protein HRS9139_06279 [Pyrenophora teres f. teres]KAE8858128.1 hypothetical protein PTNB29_07343 [Pyrenophora teres f. teres]KAE8862033.1 hypothetical protein PTNB73_07587 [Pyrenophora teres f. teres]CAE7208205.1 phosphotransferase enzyme family protein [Pyrenophora teres f. teres]